MEPVSNLIPLKCNTYGHKCCSSLLKEAAVTSYWKCKSDSL